MPQIVPDDVFQAAQHVSRDNTQWSPRRAEPGQWLLRGLLRCGTCGVGVNCHKMRGRNGTFHRCYYCRNHDPLRAGGEHRRCPERNIRADALDAFVFDQVRQALLRPQVLLAGEHAVAVRAPAPDDQLLAAQLGRLDRKAEAAAAEHRRLVDCYQAGLIDLVEPQRRVKELDIRRRAITEQRHALADQHDALAKTTAYGSASAHSPSGSSPHSTASTSPSASSCCGWWSRRSGSAAGTSRSACASPWTTTPTATRQASHPHPGPATQGERQAMTVCVPSVAISGPSYRLKDRLKPSDGGGALE